MRLFLLTLGLCAAAFPAVAQNIAPGVAGFVVSSTTFTEGGKLTDRNAYNTGECALFGGNVSPPIAWEGAPPETQSFALTVFDPDARNGEGWYHWVVFNIPASAPLVAEGAGINNNAILPGGAIQGRNDYGANAYGGPCPPLGDAAHHYIFTVWALDVPALNLPESTGGAALAKAMEPHVLAKGMITGTYMRVPPRARI